MRFQIRQVLSLEIFFGRTLLQRISRFWQTMLLRTRSKIAVKIVITLALLVFLLFQVSWESVQNTLVQAHIGLVILSFAIFFSRSLFGAVRWKALLAVKNYSMSTADLTKYYLIGTFFNFFFPTVVGGDLARGYYLHSDGVSKKTTISSMIVERLLGVLSLACLSCLSLVMSVHIFRNTGIIGLVVGAAAVFLGIFVLLFHSGFEALVRSIAPAVLLPILEPGMRLLQDIREYSNTVAVLIYGFGITMFFQVLGVYSVYLIGLSMGSSTKLIFFLTLVPVVWLISMIPVSLNGLGVREGAFVYLFAFVGMEKEMALAISLIFLLQSILQGIVGGMLFAFDMREVSAIRDYRK